jgi:hypothetical protein
VAYNLIGVKYMLLARFLLFNWVAALTVFGQYVPQIKDAPFSGEYRIQVTTFSDGSRYQHPVESRKVYRDRFGRTRTDLLATVIEIVDPVENFIYMLTPRTKTAYKRPYQPPNPFNVENELGDRLLERQDLGVKTMLGVDVLGTRLKIRLPDHPDLTRDGENWKSQDLDIFLKMKSADPLEGERTVEMIKLDQAEPDPLIFQVPSDYKLIDQTQ